jgi:hypothetical protein
MLTEEQVRDAWLGAVERARLAPSFLNTQPWRWHPGERSLELYADRSRQITSIDPDGRLLILSCGTSLHHARTALTGAGFDVVVDRFPQPSTDDLLARMSVTDRHEPRTVDVQMLRNLRNRHSDRRPFAATVPVPGEAMSALTSAVEAEHARLYQLRESQKSILTEAAQFAAAAEAQMPEYQAELSTWTRRPQRSGDGVARETIAPQVARPVPVRDFAPGRETMLDPGFGEDQFTEYVIVATAADGPTEWLTAGEATSAAWLTATGAGLVMSVMSDVIEIPGSRAQLRGLLPEPGHPQLVLRLGLDMQPTPAPPSRRRAAADVIDESGQT